jgi:hypothetical protein
MAHRDLSRRIHVRNAAEIGQTRTDANAPKATARHKKRAADNVLLREAIPVRLSI